MGHETRWPTRRFRITIYSLSLCFIIYLLYSCKNGARAIKALRKSCPLNDKSLSLSLSLIFWVEKLPSGNHVPTIIESSFKCGKSSTPRMTHSTLFRSLKPDRFSFGQRARIRIMKQWNAHEHAVTWKNISSRYKKNTIATSGCIYIYVCIGLVRHEMIARARQLLDCEFSSSRGDRTKKIHNAISKCAL